MELRLVPIGPSFPGRRKFFDYRCSCGTIVRCIPRTAVGKRYWSCGCLKTEVSRAKARAMTEVSRVANVVHGHSRRSGRSAEYRTWKQMLGRCRNQNNKKWPNYGGRGICVCARWSSTFLDFHGDMGPKPSPRHSIDRINNDGNYSCGRCAECTANGWPANCRWATAKQQANNQRVRRTADPFFLNGERLSGQRLSLRLGFQIATIRRRLSEGWPLFYAAMAPPLTSSQCSSVMNRARLARLA